MAPEQFVSDILVGSHERRGHRLRTGLPLSDTRRPGTARCWSGFPAEYGYRYFIVDKERDEEGKIISSTYIREMLADGNIRKANDLLGYCYFVYRKSGAWKCHRAYKAISDGESDPAGCEAPAEVRRLCDAGDCGRKGLRRPYECRKSKADRSPGIIRSEWRHISMIFRGGSLRKRDESGAPRFCETGDEVRIDRRAEGAAGS